MTKSKKQLTSTTNSMAANRKRILFTWVCFLAYLLLLSYVLFFSELFGRTDSSQEYRYNLILFQEINRYYGIGERTGSWLLFILNVCGNVAVFIPLGLFSPVLFKQCKNMFFMVLLSMEISLFVEVTQLITRVGSFDVDDILLNAIGGLCGYLCYICIRWWSRFDRKKKRRK